MSTIFFNVGPGLDIDINVEPSEEHIQQWVDAQRWATLHPNHFLHMFNTHYRGGAEFYLRADKIEQEVLKAAFDTVYPVFMDFMRTTADASHLVICEHIAEQTPRTDNPSLAGTIEQQEAAQYLARIYIGLYNERYQEIEEVNPMADALVADLRRLKSKI